MEPRIDVHLLTLNEPAEWREACLASLKDAPIQLHVLPGIPGRIGEASLIGFVLLIPLVFIVARRTGVSLIKIGIPLLAPHRKTVHIGAYGYKAGGLDDHRLIEVAGREGFAQSPVLCNDQAVKLHIAARRGTRGGFEHVLQHLRRNRLRAEFSDRTVFCKQCFHTDYKLRNKFTQK